MSARPERLLLGAVLALAAAGAFAACNGEDDRSSSINVGGQRVPVAILEDAARGLCTARDQARTDVNVAEATFYDRSHDALHTIARALEPVDRAQAARLLEDKQRVEASFAPDRPPGDVAADLDRLARVTRTGLATLGVSSPECA